MLNKVNGLELGRTRGLDTSEAYKELNIPQDPREYNRVVDVWNDLQITSIRLLTNNLRKIEGVASAGNILFTDQSIEDGAYDEPV